MERSRPPEHRKRAAASAASSMFCGSGPLPSLTDLAAQRCHVPGRNCIGPTARSQRVSPSRRPRSVSGIARTPGEPSSGTPMMDVPGSPSSPMPPPSSPCRDSIRPMPASVAHDRLHPGCSPASHISARP
ncbi:hypothetical protein ACFSVJ_22915 [Prauserella oleivorans]